jgi:hypothetical protein
MLKKCLERFFSVLTIISLLLPLPTAVFAKPGGGGNITTNAASSVTSTTAVLNGTITNTNAGTPGMKTRAVVLQILK